MRRHYMYSSTFQFENLNILVQQFGENPKVLLLHGAGDSSQSTLECIAQEYENLGIGVITFDFPGHGSSDGNIIESSLSERLRVSEAIIAKYFQKMPQIIAGFSMSGQTIIQLIERFPNIPSVVLFCPKLYSDKAIHLKFNHSFDEEVSRPHSYSNSFRSQYTLSNYKGKVHLINSAEEQTIQTEMASIYQINCKNVEVTKLPNTSHKLLHWLHKNPSKLRDLVQSTLHTLSYQI